MIVILATDGKLELPRVISDGSTALSTSITATNISRGSLILSDVRGSWTDFRSSELNVTFIGVLSKSDSAKFKSKISILQFKHYTAHTLCICIHTGVKCQ